jgi:hypothetical protein
VIPAGCRKTLTRCSSTFSEVPGAADSGRYEAEAPLRLDAVTCYRRLSLAEMITELFFAVFLSITTPLNAAPDIHICSAEPASGSFSLVSLMLFGCLMPRCCALLYINPGNLPDHILSPPAC